MHKLITFITAAMMFAVSAAAQQPTAKEFNDRYQLLVSKLGPSGVGIETLLERWEQAYPDDADMLLGKFTYYFAKSQSKSIVLKEQDKYLGVKPVLSLKDSTGKKVNYFEEVSYDDEMFGLAQKAIEKTIQVYPDRLDLRFMKSASLIGYEKESPDMALSYLKGLAAYNGSQHPKWTYPGTDNVDYGFFSAAMQEYCYLFFTYGTPAAYEAFRDLSSTMLSYKPDDTLFLDNMGSYYLVAKQDNKTALKYYTKVLKLKSDDLTAIKNIILMARKSKDTKLEKKYLPLLIKHTDSESEKLAAEARLKQL